MTGASKWSAFLFLIGCDSTTLPICKIIDVGGTRRYLTRTIAGSRHFIAGSELGLAV